MVIGGLVALIAFVGLMFAIRVPPTPDIDSTAIYAAELNDPRMLEIEHQFACPCGNCGHDDLADCTCDVPGGVLEMKTAIARHLKDGASTQEVVAAVAERFGGLKTPSEVSASAHIVDSQPPLRSAHGNGADPTVMLRVVSQFDCPCGNCRLSLLDCTCDESRGAMEIKGFIRDRLAAGLAADQVAEGVERQYGGGRYSPTLQR
jgi:cytochrome c-type biogenesis protein CcmH/NrfF